jgi:hypothetical protein
MPVTTLQEVHDAQNKMCNMVRSWEGGKSKSKVNATILKPGRKCKYKWTTQEGEKNNLNTPRCQKDFLICIVLLPISDWLDSLIGPSGLLLVVSHLVVFPVSVSWVWLEKSK